MYCFFNLYLNLTTLIFMIILYYILEFMLTPLAINGSIHDYLLQ
jgi:hypothetical protein